MNIEKITKIETEVTIENETHSHEIIEITNYGIKFIKHDKFFCKSNIHVLIKKHEFIYIEMLTLRGHYRIQIMISNSDIDNVIKLFEEE